MMDKWRDTLRHPEVCANPIFILGAPRSGTTILAKSLGRHSCLWSSEESEFILDLFGDGQIDKAYERARALNGPSWLRTQAVGREEFFAFVGLGINAMFT